MDFKKIEKFFFQIWCNGVVGVMEVVKK